MREPHPSVAVGRSESDVKFSGFILDVVGIEHRWILDERFDIRAPGVRHRAARPEVCSVSIPANGQWPFAAIRRDNLRCDCEPSRTMDAVGAGSQARIGLP